MLRQFASREDQDLFSYFVTLNADFYALPKLHLLIDGKKTPQITPSMQDAACP